MISVPIGCGHRYLLKLDPARRVVPSFATPLPDPHMPVADLDPDF